jgi:hypothetical protein
MQRLWITPWLALIAAGCVPIEPVPDGPPAPDPEVLALRDQLAASHAALLEASTLQSDDAQRIERGISELSRRLDDMPQQIAERCAPAPTPEPATAGNCEPLPPRAGSAAARDDNKMIVGELERVWLDPPGVNLVARIDTGTQSSTLLTDSLVEFERDGDRWVRFEIAIDDVTRSLERPVLRHVRVSQNAEGGSDRRPVVNIRLQIGDLQDTFEFNLTEGSHADYRMLLGRSFLTDIALVDVARRFVQPAHTGESD